MKSRIAILPLFLVVYCVAGNSVCHAFNHCRNPRTHAGGAGIHGA
jgi:hypothetical protein